MIYALAWAIFYALHILHVSLSVSLTQADWLTFKIYLCTFKKQTSVLYYDSVKYF